MTAVRSSGQRGSRSSERISRALQTLGYAALWCAAASCAQSLVGSPVLHPAQTSRAPDDATSSAPASAAAPAPWPDPEHALIVGNEQGLELWALDGTARRTLSVGPAFHPRKLGADAVLALSGTSEEPQLGKEFVRISLRDGSRTTIARVPGFRCGAL